MASVQCDVFCMSAFQVGYGASQVAEVLQCPVSQNAEGVAGS